MNKHIERGTVKNDKDSFLKFPERSVCLFYRWSSVALFVLAAYLITVVYNRSFFCKAEELSLFLPTRLFFTDCMQQAGGLLVYGGAFLTQFFYYPWLGGTFLVGLLWLLQFFVVKAFWVPDRYFPLTFIPSVMLLLSAVQLGYLIYILKSPGYLYSNLLGTIVSVCCFWGYRQLPSWPLRSLALFLFVSLAYPLFGFYALWSVLLCVVYEGAVIFKEKTGVHWIPVGTGIFMAVTVPYLYYVFFYSQMWFGRIYTASLPDFYFNKAEIVLWIPFFVTGISLLLFICCLFMSPVKREKRFFPGVVFFVFLLSLVALWKYSWHDENFRVSLDMDRAVFRNDWEGVLKLARRLKGEPTRLIVMHTNLALQKTGRAGDEMFRYKNSSTPYVVYRDPQVLRQMGAKSLYFHYGKINYCYRWCMEDKVEYGQKVEYLKYMVKCALLNREPELARKYNNVLKKTWFHKDWAVRYQRFIDDPASMEEDPEFRAITPLMAYDNLLDGDAGLLEVYLLNNFAYMEGGPEKLVELSLQCNLILKNIERFWPRFFLYAKTHDRLPVHYQEAALLYAYLERKVDVSPFRIDPSVHSRFTELIRMSETYGDRPEEFTRAVMKRSFGNTFWYYYFFVKDLKTN